jgi:hypothetical protein
MQKKSSMAEKAGWLKSFRQLLRCPKIPSEQKMNPK